MPRGLQIRYAAQRAPRTTTGWISTASPAGVRRRRNGGRLLSKASGQDEQLQVRWIADLVEPASALLDQPEFRQHLEAFDRQTDTLLRALAGSLEELMALEGQPGAAGWANLSGGSASRGAAQCPSSRVRRRADPGQASGVVFDGRRSGEGARGADARERYPQDRVSQRRPSRWVAGPCGSFRQSRGGRSQRKACRDSRVVGQNDQSSFGSCARQTEGSSTHLRTRHPVPPGCRRPLHRKQAAVCDERLLVDELPPGSQPDTPRPALADWVATGLTFLHTVAGRRTAD